MEVERKCGQAAGRGGTPRIAGVDLFCGAGGLTYGLVKAGVDVRAGVDLDPECAYPYTANNPGRFLEQDVRALSGRDLASLWRGADVSLLAGCAPCQPFSTYSQARDRRSNRDWGMLLEFGRLVAEAQPDLITMENVPQLAGDDVFMSFLDGLKGYSTWHGVVDCAEYGVPQQRRRFVLIASRLGPISLLLPVELGYRRATVWSAIGRMPPLVQGSADPHDPIHAAAGMSALNLRRIRASSPGGSWREWPPALRAACHRRESGAGYGAVYGRMEWDRPAPTMTTLCHGFGNGRFGHPQQDRAISLREAAILQTFPKRYKFVRPGERVKFTTVGRLIGNAVPPRLGEVIGRSLIAHATAVAERRAEPGVVVDREAVTPD
ncbi:DNA cytosine methyltransferase [Cognatilysobacter xinjiangensis]|uniref:DNA cytosine methyltransferase n=1 Tax=Cognatilysobacter xinjiangensis TaxID=546892 RepID=UPI0016749BDD|nr:DNA cytosine methyltransferase [Lysobacter xinjiangensis]